MNKDPVYQAELAHDTSGVNVEPFLAEALTSIVEQLMSGEKVNGWTLHAFLDEQPDIGELAAAAIISGDFTTFKDMIEGRLRRELYDSDAVHDLAAEMAAAPEDQS